MITKKALRTFSAPRITTALVQVGRPGLDGSLPGELQIYSAKLRFVAHLTGLRWLMYYHRIISFFLFCGIFFTISLLSALVLWAAAGYIWTKEEESAAGDMTTDEIAIKTEDDGEEKSESPLRKRSYSRGKKEDLTRRELQDQARRLAEARRQDDALFHGGTDTEGEEDLRNVQTEIVQGEEGIQSVLRHLHFDSEGEGVIVKSESGTTTTSERSSPNWQDLSFTGNETLPIKVKKEEQPEEVALANSARIKKEGEESSTSARLARENSLRRRASNRSMKEQRKE